MFVRIYVTIRNKFERQAAILDNLGTILGDITTPTPTPYLGNSADPLLLLK